MKLTDYVPRSTFYVPRFLFCYLLFAICYLLASCAPPASQVVSAWDAAPVVKIGVIAPFEGMGRPLGYAVLPAIKAAVTEANASGELGHYKVLVVAFNDDLYGPTAASQARALALDPDVMAVLGPWSAETVASVAPILDEASLASVARADLAAPPAGQKWGDAVLSAAAARAGDDARLLLRALAEDIRLHGRPTRGGVAAAVQRSG